jgi:D-alanine-D-alanine ligase
MSASRNGQNRRHVSDAADFGRVALLLGGASAERDISLKTGMAVLAALRARGVDVTAIDPAENGLERLAGGDYDRVWLALHGRGGEDGMMQGALDIIGLPYTGSGVLGSAVSMDKLRSKQLFRAWGLATPEWAVMAAAEEARAIVEQLGLPLIVKPAGEGSSVGMSKVVAADELPTAWAEAARYDDCVLVERWVEGAEYSVGILQGEALPIVRIETPRVFYDYEAKYFSDDTRYFCPAGLDDALEAECRAASLTAFRAVGASGWGRVDFLMGPDRRPHFLEVNTIPGMTSHSLVPMGAKAAGIDFEELVWRVLETSMAAPEDGHGA